METKKYEPLGDIEEFIEQGLGTEQDYFNEEDKRLSEFFANYPIENNADRLADFFVQERRRVPPSYFYYGCTNCNCYRESFEDSIRRELVDDYGIDYYKATDIANELGQKLKSRAIELAEEKWNEEE